MTHNSQAVFIQKLVCWWIPIANVAVANEMQTLRANPRVLSPHHSYRRGFSARMRRMGPYANRFSWAAGVRGGAAAAVTA